MPTDSFSIQGKIKLEKSFTLTELDSFPKQTLKNTLFSFCSFSKTPYHSSLSTSVIFLESLFFGKPFIFTVEQGEIYPEQLRRAVVITQRNALGLGVMILNASPQPYSSFL